MDSMILGWSFATAVIIAACVTSFFNDAIDEALGLVVPPELGAAWRRCS